jgi:hypothetical protein
MMIALLCWDWATEAPSAGPSLRHSPRMPPGNATSSKVSYLTIPLCVNVICRTLTPFQRHFNCLPHEPHRAVDG